jgi:predicted dehydrogenase
MKKNLRVGVVGVGYLGTFHAEKYAGIEGIELAGVVDIVPERAERIAERFGTKAFVDYRKLIGLVDAVSIVVPTQMHFPISKDFLENDVDVLIEKPMTETLEEADALIQTADSRDRLIQVGHLERFNPAVVALGEMLERPLFIESDRLHIPKEAKEGEKARGTEVDVVLDLMIHDIDIVLSLVRSEVKTIHALGVPVITSHVDIANARLVFENGCVANITASRISLKNMRKIRIFQKDNYVSTDLANHEMAVFRKDGKGSALPIPGVSFELQNFEEADALRSELEAFVHSVRSRDVPAVSGRDGRNALRVALSIINQIQETTEDLLRKGVSI